MLCLQKQAKIYKFAKKCLFFPLTLVRGHLKIVPSYLAIQIKKSQKIPKYYLKKRSNYKRFCKGRASKARPLQKIFSNSFQFQLQKILFRNKKFSVYRVKLFIYRFLINTGCP